MDERTIKEILATARLDDALERTKRPQLSAFAGWGPWIAGVILFAFMAWLIGVGVMQMTLDAVNGMLGQ